METLGDALPKEIERVQEIIREYEKIPAGHLAAEMMKADVKRAQEAMMSGDLAGMLAAYQALKEYEL
ncbi:hypothetical protein DNH61_11720 [Paenibacillus sambharensis]|uniref:Uncharacterized protein n=1 Tax=Paenibacillus sambharensis TaxID=1803190 RepID=A0A2W1LTV7_9BACL|nr:hypothetical protein [Paenibacillus sambharensis]PZD95221.1 hypothetical protein DNH61_11720 [Paenibacillus sambharensis]